MTTKKLFSLLIAVLTTSLTSFIGFTGGTINGKVTTNEYKISDYTSIDNSLNTTINYSHYNTAPTCEVFIDENILPNLEIKDGELTPQRKKQYEM